MSAYPAEHERARPQVLAEEPLCPGYPPGQHDGEQVRTTQLDHKIPLSAGGTTTRENLGALCGPCNSRKGRDERRRTWRDR